MHVRRAVPHLCAALGASMLACTPLIAGADSLPSVDSLWSQPQGVSIDSPLYPLQAWWDGFNRSIPTDPTQRGLSELNRANQDLLNAYTLLQQAHRAGADPVPVIDPLLSSAYEAVTGSKARAPLGSLGRWIDESLLKLEGRDARSDLARGLLQDYRVMQAVAVRDLHAQGGSDADAVLAACAQREADFLNRVAAISLPEDGIGLLVAEATTQTAAHTVHSQAAALTHRDNGGHDSDGGGHGHPSGKGALDAKLKPKVRP